MGKPEWSTAVSAGEYTIGLLGAKVRIPVIGMSIEEARLQEIERRILAIEAASPPPEPQHDR